MSTMTILTPEDADWVLRQLERLARVELQKEGLLCDCDQNDLRGLMELLLRRGHRRVTQDDLVVAKVLLKLDFLEDFLSKERRKPNGIVAQRVRISEIYTAEAVVQRRQTYLRKCDAEDPKLGEAVRRLVATLPTEPSYTLVLNGKDPVSKRRNPRIGRLSADVFIFGSSTYPYMRFQEPEVLSQVFLVKIDS